MLRWECTKSSAPTFYNGEGGEGGGAGINFTIDTARICIQHISDRHSKYYIHACKLKGMIKSSTSRNMKSKWRGWYQNEWNNWINLILKHRLCYSKRCLLPFWPFFKLSTNVSMGVDEYWYRVTIYTWMQHVYTRMPSIWRVPISRASGRWVCLFTTRAWDNISLLLNNIVTLVQKVIIPNKFGSKFLITLF